MSFKDKPLKKIVADTRVTIDAIHTGIVKDFKENKELLEEKKRELKSFHEMEKTDEVLMKIKFLESEIKKIETKKEDEVNYYLETSNLLNE